MVAGSRSVISNVKAAFPAAASETSTEAVFWKVLVDFESGNAEKPFVAGSHYNGKAKASKFGNKNRGSRH